VFFAVIGLFLLFMRSTNRDFFNWNLKSLFRTFKPA